MPPAVDFPPSPSPVAATLDPAAAPTGDSDDPTREAFRRTFRFMLLARTLDDKLAALYRAGKIAGGVYTGTGQEAISAALGSYLRRGRDVYAPLIRDLGGRLAFGEEVLDVTRTYLGSRLGPMRGRDGNIHRGRPREGLLAMISHLGTTVSVVAGVLFARRLAGRLDDAVGATCIGDGGTSTGSFHEGLNLAAVEKLPVVIVVANNQYAYSTPNSRQFACADLLDRAVGYGVEGHAVNGTDLGACLEVVGRAVARARAGRGPQLVVARLLRIGGHGVHDDGAYMDPRLREGVHGGDCVRLAEATLRERRWARPEELAGWREETAAQVEAAVSQTQREPAPEAADETWRVLASRPG